MRRALAARLLPVLLESLVLRPVNLESKAPKQRRSISLSALMMVRKPTTTGGMVARKLSSRPFPETVPVTRPLLSCVGRGSLVISSRTPLLD
jgi:hypothetical protein